MGKEKNYCRKLEDEYDSQRGSGISKYFKTIGCK